jgi:geranylgeranyl pyrophosphate synthase
MERALNEADLAKEALQHLPDNRFKSVMIELADFSVSRLS